MATLYTAIYSTIPSCEVFDMVFFKPTCQVFVMIVYFLNQQSFYLQSILVVKLFCINNKEECVRPAIPHNVKNLIIILS